jgi:hypothetical protein
MREARGFAPPPRNGFAFSWRLHYTYHPHSPSIAYLEYLESLTILNEYIPISERLISEALPPLSGRPDRRYQGRLRACRALLDHGQMG